MNFEFEILQICYQSANLLSSSEHNHKRAVRFFLLYSVVFSEICQLYWPMLRWGTRHCPHCHLANLRIPAKQVSQVTPKSKRIHSMSLSLPVIEAKKRCHGAALYSLEIRTVKDQISEFFRKRRARNALTKQST